MAEAKFDDLIHSPLRLRICGLLNAAESVAFSVVRDTVGVTDAHLSKQVKVLTDAGYVNVMKAGSLDREDARRVAWLSLTSKGRKAFGAHVLALRQILPEVD
ncbi:transcriptional regulator [Kocuria sp. M4R2S49]|uniref:transcriptional regulator n=1 Tax=Kocuria rhizosphaericola TaxID=3376284 RepID=UPI0037A32C3F